MLFSLGSSSQHSSSSFSSQLLSSKILRYNSSELVNNSSLINSDCWIISGNLSSPDSSATKISKKLGTVVSVVFTSTDFPSILKLKYIKFLTKKFKGKNF